MSQVSPYARSTAERSQHRQTTALLIGVVAAIIFSTLWLTSPNQKFLESEPSESPHKSPLATERKPEIDSVDADDKSVVDWSARTDSIDRELPESSNAELNELKQRLHALARVLEREELSTNAQATVRDSLNGLRQQAVVLRAQSNRATVNADGFAEGIASAAQSILIAEQEAMRQAREQAEREIRQKREPTIRDVRLELRDNQDKAADLRHQITQMQRQQTEFRAKTARADALRRQMTDVRRLLTPFTAAGHMQPNSNHNGYDTEHTVDPAPVSLLRLRKLGALEPTMEGLGRLYTFGGKRNAGFKNKLPLGAFSPSWEGIIKKPEVLAVVKRAQQLLREHGQAMVEARLLSP